MRLQPTEQFFAKSGYERPRQGLVKMMVRIDKTWQDDVLRCVEYRVDWLLRLLSCCDSFRNSVAFDDEPAFGAISKDCKRVPNPQSRHDDYFNDLGQNKKPAPVGAGFR